MLDRLDMSFGPIREGKSLSLNTALLDGYRHSIVIVRRQGFRQVVAMTTYNHTIPDRSPPGSTRTAPSAVHQDGVLLVHHRRFEEETTTPSALGTQGREMDRY